MINRADCEFGSVIYYEESNRNTFVAELTAFEELSGFVGILSIEDVINLILQDSKAVNWEENALHEKAEKEIYYKCFISQNKDLAKDFPPILKEITERKSRIQNPVKEKCLLVNVLGAYNFIDPISIVKGGLNLKPVLYDIEFCNDFETLDKWFELNRYRRTYNKTDNRHIETHPDYRKKKSPLLDGLAGKNNAEKLLITALGDQRDRGYLINIDETHKCLIRFEFENNIQNQFHGYHLVVPNSHLKDTVAEKLISTRLIDLLEYREKRQQESK